MGEVTELISRAHHGDLDAQSLLFKKVYAELKQVASRQVRRMHNTPLHTTTLVHEAYFRLAKPEALTAKDREHFFSIAGRAMRQLLLDEVRARQSFKRSQDLAVSLDDASQIAIAIDPGVDVFALEQALSALEKIDLELARLVELRFYLGLELAEIAEMTERSERSLKRDWRKARAFLHAQLADQSGTLPE